MYFLWNDEEGAHARSTGEHRVLAQLVPLPGNCHCHIELWQCELHKQEQARENHWSWYSLRSCRTYLDCELPQDQIPDALDFFWLIYAIIILVPCNYAQP